MKLYIGALIRILAIAGSCFIGSFVWEYLYEIPVIKDSTSRCLIIGLTAFALLILSIIGFMNWVGDQIDNEKSQTNQQK